MSLNSAFRIGAEDERGTNDTEFPTPSIAASDPMNNRKKTALILVGLLGLVWWWMRAKTKQSDAQTDSSGLDTILSKVFPQSNPNGGLGDLKTLLDVAEAAGGEDPKPKPDAWMWIGGMSPGKVVPLTEFLEFNKSKCTDFAGNPSPCEKEGRPCTRGFDC